MGIEDHNTLALDPSKFGSAVCSAMSSPVTSSLAMSVAALQQQPLVFTTMPMSSASGTLLQDHGDLIHTSLSGSLANSMPGTTDMTPIVVSSYSRRPNHMSDLESDNDEVLNHNHTPGTDHSPLTSPGLLSPGLETPGGNGVDGGPYHDVNTQMSLVEVSSKLNIVDEASMGGGGTVDVDSSSLWGMVDADHAEGVRDDHMFRKVRKSMRKSDASSCVHSESADEEIVGFDANGAISTSQFVFSKFGTEVPCIFSPGVNSNVMPASSVALTSSSNRASGTIMSVVCDSTSNSPPPPGSSSKASKAVTSSSSSSGGGGGECAVSSNQPQVFLAPHPPTSKRVKLKKQNQDCSSLSIGYPRIAHGYELKILCQPEEQHRARYMTEGSRGAIKDQSGQGSPQIQLLGVSRPVTCQIFVGSDTGKVRPHGFYQACRVAGRNSTPCMERDVDGTSVIEVELHPSDNMIASIDCVGILKLRNADVEQRIGISRAKKKSTRVRMVFRVAIPTADGGSSVILQAASTPISCTQPAGQPEISKKSLSEADVRGGQELFIIGKNFVKQGAKVMFQEKEMCGEQQDVVVWQQKAELDTEHFQQTHMICVVPAYRRTTLSEPVSVEIVIHCANRSSEPVPFTYTSSSSCSSESTAAAMDLPQPAVLPIEVKMEEPEDMPMETADESNMANSPAASNSSGSNSSSSSNCQHITRSKFVSPVALAMNELYAKATKEGGGAAPNMRAIKAAAGAAGGSGGGGQLADTLTELQELLQECSQESERSSPITVEPATIEQVGAAVAVLKQEDQQQQAGAAFCLDPATGNDLLSGGFKVPATSPLERTPSIDTGSSQASPHVVDLSGSTPNTPDTHEFSEDQPMSTESHTVVTDLDNVCQQQPFVTGNDFDLAPERSQGFDASAGPSQQQQHEQQMVPSQHEQNITAAAAASPLPSPHLQQQMSPHQQMMPSPHQSVASPFDHQQQQQQQEQQQQQQQGSDGFEVFLQQQQQDGQLQNQQQQQQAMHDQSAAMEGNNFASSSISNNISNNSSSMSSSMSSSINNLQSMSLPMSVATAPFIVLSTGCSTTSMAPSSSSSAQQSMDYVMPSRFVGSISSPPVIPKPVTAFSPASTPTPSAAASPLPAVQLLQQSKSLQNAVVNQLATSLQQQQQLPTSTSNENAGGSVDLLTTMQELVTLMKVQNSQLDQLTRQQPQQIEVKDEPNNKGEQAAQLQQQQQQQHVYQQAAKPIGSVSLAPASATPVITLQQLLASNGIMTAQAPQQPQQQIILQPSSQQQQQQQQASVVTAEMLQMVKQEAQQNNVQLTSPQQIASLLQAQQTSAAAAALSNSSLVFTPASSQHAVASSSQQQQPILIQDMSVDGHNAAPVNMNRIAGLPPFSHANSNPPHQ